MLNKPKPETPASFARGEGRFKVQGFEATHGKLRRLHSLLPFQQSKQATLLGNVIPAKAGIQMGLRIPQKNLDSRLRGNDVGVWLRSVLEI